MPALGRLLIVLGDAGKCEMFKTIGLWSEHLVVALPKDHPLAGKPIVYWPDLRGERFLVTVRDPGPDIRVVLLRHLAAPSDHPVIVTCRLSRESFLSEVAEGRVSRCNANPQLVSPASASCSGRSMTAAAQPASATSRAGSRTMRTRR
jgi:DNA-binding transcriptional LysR family regulator